MLGRCLFLLTLVALASLGAALPARLLLPLQMDYEDEWSVDAMEKDAGMDSSGVVGGKRPDLSRVDLLTLLPGLQKNKRYLGIDLPDYIASKKELGKLKQKMLTSGK